MRLACVLVLLSVRACTVLPTSFDRLCLVPKDLTRATQTHIYPIPVLLTGFERLGKTQLCQFGGSARFKWADAQGSIGCWWPETACRVSAVQGLWMHWLDSTKLQFQRLQYDSPEPMPSRGVRACMPQADTRSPMAMALCLVWPSTQIQDDHPTCVCKLFVDRTLVAQNARLRVAGQLVSEIWRESEQG